jgi:hypothetical protein
MDQERLSKGSATHAGEWLRMKRKDPMTVDQQETHVEQGGSAITEPYYDRTLAILLAPEMWLSPGEHRDTHQLAPRGCVSTRPGSTNLAMFAAAQLLVPGNACFSRGAAE